MALRGDPIPGERFFTPEEGGHQYSCELVEQITRMNHGQYLDDTLTEADSHELLHRGCRIPGKTLRSSPTKPVTSKT